MQPRHRPPPLALAAPVALVLLLTFLLPARPLLAQTAWRIEADPPSMVIARGESAALVVRVLDGDGRVLDEAVRMVGSRRALSIGGGVVVGLEVGEWEVIVTTARPGPDGRPAQFAVPVVVEWPPVVRVEVTGPRTLYEGTTVTHRAIALHGDGTNRPGADFEWRTSDPGRAEVDVFGHVRALAPGPVRIEAAFEGVTGAVEHTVREFAGASLEIVGGADRAVRTGDVQTFAAIVRDEGGVVIADAPVEWSHSYVPAVGIVAPAAPGQMENGRIVADVPGEFTVVARSGGLRATRTFEAVQRRVVRAIEVVGRGRQERVYSTDFWVFEGVDGRDYALVGSKQSDGHGFAFDITDPENVVKTDSVQVDARSVNDIKVSPDGQGPTDSHLIEVIEVAG
ncbi:MAG: hypothetical protein OXN18_01725, partial [Gemmatimonadota bacterium]|nr:hypothetical protein [Gemmatimonadota bacterium]